MSLNFFHCQIRKEWIVVKSHPSGLDLSLDDFDKSLNPRKVE